MKNNQSAPVITMESRDSSELVCGVDFGADLFLWLQRHDDELGVPGRIQHAAECLSVLSIKPVPGSCGPARQLWQRLRHFDRIAQYRAQVDDLATGQS